MQNVHIHSVYTQKDLARMARSAVKGLGRYHGFAVVIRGTGTTECAHLHAYHVRHPNPHKPIAMQAIEYQTVRL